MHWTKNSAHHSVKVEYNRFNQKTKCMVWMPKERIKRKWIKKHTKPVRKKFLFTNFLVFVSLRCSSRGPPHTMLCFNVVLSLSIHTLFDRRNCHFAQCSIGINARFCFALLLFCFFFVEPMLIVIACFSPNRKWSEKNNGKKGTQQKRRAKKYHTCVLLCVVWLEFLCAFSTTHSIRCDDNNSMTNTARLKGTVRISDAMTNL